MPEGHPLRAGYDVVCCSRCFFVYADTEAKQKDYDRFYAEFSKYESPVSNCAGQSPHDLDRLRKTAACISKVIPSRDARILDVGCGSGGLLAVLQGLGYRNLQGVDASRGCVDSLMRAKGIAAEVGSIFRLRPGMGQFHCVTLTHVLEHVEDVRGALANVVELLIPGGCVYLEVPNASRYAEYMLAPFQEFNTEHINHFSARSLNNACGVAGLRLVGGGEKVFDQSAGMPFPTVFGFWQKDDDPTREVVPDPSILESIGEYIRLSREKLARYDAQIRLILAKTPKIIVWGTGELTLKLLHDTALGTADIVAFVDGNETNQGKKLRNLTIIGPSGIRDLTNPILVASTIHFEEISAAIRAAFGLEREIIGLQ